MLSENEPTIVAQPLKSASVGRTLGTIAALFLVTFVGIILVWTITSWKKSTKVIATIFAILYLPFSAIVLLWFGFGFLYSGGSIQPFLPNDQIALSHLKNKYNEDFVIGRETGSDQLGGPITYGKRVHLKRDFSIEFVINKCLARCGVGSTSYSTEFTDTYPQVVWSKQMTEKLTKYMASDSRTGKYTVYASTTATDGIISVPTKRIIPIDKLSPAVKKTIGYSVYYAEPNSSYTLQNRAEHADAILKIEQYIAKQNVGGHSITYDIHTTTPAAAAKNNKDQFHFDSKKAVSVTNREDIYKAFTVYTHGRSYNLQGDKKPVTPSDEPSKCRQVIGSKDSVEISGENKKIQEYLHKKYAQSFTVRDCYMIYSSPEGLLKDYVILAYPSDNKEHIFGVARDTSEEKTTYKDNYLQIRWSDDARQEINDLLVQHYVVNPYFDIVITPSQSLADSAYQDPAFQSVKNNIRNDIAYDLTIRNYVNETVPMTRDQHLDRIKTIANYLTTNYPKAQLHYLTEESRCDANSTEISRLKMPAGSASCLR